MRKLKYSVLKTSIHEDLQGDMDIDIHLDDFHNDMDLDIKLDDYIPMNKTNNDVFLRKLGLKVNPSPDSPPHEEPYIQMDDNEAIVANGY